MDPKKVFDSIMDGVDADGTVYDYWADQFAWEVDLFGDSDTPKSAGL